LTSAQITEEVTRLMHPFGRLTEDLGELFTCVICSETMAQPMATSCGHSFHPECLIEWLKKQSTCPVCRAVVTPRTVQQPVILREAIEKYNELRPAVDVVQRYMTELQHRVKAAQAALGTQAAVSDQRKRDLDAAEERTAELARQKDEAAAALHAAEQRLEQMQRQLVLERTRLEAERDEAERRAAPSAALTTPAATTTTQSGFWKAVASIQSPLRYLLPLMSTSPSHCAGSGIGGLASVEEYRIMERRGCEAECQVYRAIHKRTGSVVALKRVTLCWLLEERSGEEGGTPKPLEDDLPTKAVM
jgi:hypothetical protein